MIHHCAKYHTFLRVIALIALLALVATGCAKSRMHQIMPQVVTIQDAHTFFGYPTSIATQADGTIQHEWIHDVSVRIPGHYEEERIYDGHDRDGYPREYIRTFFVPEHMQRQYCHLTISTTAEGKVLTSHWVGNGCHAFAGMAQPPQEAQTLTKKEDKAQ